MPANDLASLMMSDPPEAVFAHKEIACCQGAPVEFLFTQHEGNIAVKKGVFIVAGNTRRIGV